ncbi:MAG: hypothetical protein COA58_09275 [Bacteroidetes bacterium]|nr:MAG: hypothetical protein COA58_09275 [Bacteroidota bacterium]
MQNAIEESEKEILLSLESDIKALSKELKETVTAIIDGGYSKFPILLAHSEDITIAQKVIDKNTHNSVFNFSASTLEEMVTRKIILNDKKMEFKAKMKSNSDSFCILLVHSESMRFVFMAKN